MLMRGSKSTTMRKSSLRLGEGRGRDLRVSFDGRTWSKLEPREGQGMIAELAEQRGMSVVKRMSGIFMMDEVDDIDDDGNGVEDV